MNINNQVVKTSSKLNASMSKVDNKDQDQIISVNSEESDKSSVLDINSYLGKDQKAYV